MTSTSSVSILIPGSSKLPRKELSAGAREKWALTMRCRRLIVWMLVFFELFDLVERLGYGISIENVLPVNKSMMRNRYVHACIGSKDERARKR